MDNNLTAALIDSALDNGFDHAGPLDASTLTVMAEVREMCAVNRCGKYGASWSCPPGCGTLEELESRMGQYRTGLLVQTVGMMEDDFDYETIVATEQRHRENLERFTSVVLVAFPNAFPMAAGSCNLCEKCTYPDAPCRFPDQVFPSMEACGLMVNQVCRDNGMKYNHGKHTICFTSCYLTE